MRAARLKVTVGVCGGVAAYKAVELVRRLQDAGYDPHVVMTRAAEQFVRPLTFAAISGHKVITTLWGEEAGTGSEAIASSSSAPSAASVTSDHGRSSVEHIEQAQTTQALVVAPATADMLAKFAHGLADDFLSTLFLATKAPVIVAAAMNVNMWQHPATRANVETLRSRGVTFVEPGSGYLACGMVGDGRLAETDEIIRAVGEAMAGAEAHSSHAEPGASGASADYAGQTVLVTAGGTREAIDPVRFLGNRSSGRMGYAVAAEARRRGARVILISAPTALACPAGVETVPVVSAEDMRTAVMHYLPEATVLVMAAAVGDYRVAQVAPRKIKRAGKLTLELEPTEDILRQAVERRRPGTLIVGFAAETEDAEANARAKLARKGVDAVVVNDVSQSGIGFEGEENAGSFLTASARVELPIMRKEAMAARILDEAAKLRTGVLPDVPTARGAVTS